METIQEKELGRSESHRHSINGGKKGYSHGFHAPAIVGAGGYLCPVATSLVVDTYEETMVDRSITVADTANIDGVTGCEGNIGDIEIHFVDTIIPGYFWIFPIGEGRVNGCGMVMHLMDKQSKKEVFAKEIITNHPNLRNVLQMHHGERKCERVATSIGSPRKKQKNQPRRMAMNGLGSSVMLQAHRSILWRRCW